MKAVFSAFSASLREHSDSNARLAIRPGIL
jgi:hypothetical protein